MNKTSRMFEAMLTQIGLEMGSKMLHDVTDIETSCFTAFWRMFAIKAVN